ncbi:MAG TPA: tetratricopeptide repeat protein [Gammaproteobacteria bacterium]|nr:tetratricopeptide repeat protein [Gammaproteobacteria bacterium]
MTGYSSEEEQIEALRQWWRANGRSVIAGIVIAVIGVVGWQQWHAYQKNQELAAAGAYEALSSDVGSQDLDAATREWATLKQDHTDSTYAVLGSLRLAAARADAGNFDAAAEALRWARKHAGDNGLGQLSRLRLAQVLDAAGKDDDAVSTLKPVPDGPYKARYQELLGDIEMARGNRDAAIKAYRAAIAANPPEHRRGLIRMKLADLGAEAEPEPTS